MTAASVFPGLRVLDLSTRLSGAFCARLFADFGADVLLAEPPEGHVLRREPPFAGDEPGPERSLLHAYANANKRSAVVRSAQDPLLAALLGWADVVISTNSEAMPSRGDAVEVSVTPYGLTGPMRDRRGNDLTACALSGWSALSGDPGEPPLKAISNQVGYLAGVNAFVGAAAALYHRDRTGESQVVDVSELESIAEIAGPALLVATYEGQAQPRHEPDYLRGPIACKDGYVFVYFGRGEFWRDAMNALGLPDLAEDQRFAQARYRRQHRDEISSRIAEQVRTRGKWELFDALDAVRCIVGVVQDTRDVVESEHLAARGFFVDLSVAGKVGVKFPGTPIKFSETPGSFRRPAPRLGEHQAEVERELGKGGNAAVSDAATPSMLAATTRPEDGVPFATNGSVAERNPRKPGSHGPLHGVRALVLTQAWSGTFGTELLGLLGADVIQVESRGRLDSWRGDYNGIVPTAIRDPGNRQRPWNTSGLYNSVNLNKRSLTLDLASARGRELFKRLVVTADVVAENFTPRVMGNFGLDYAALRRLKPDIILASLSAYGATGPYANVPGIGGTIEPMSGMSSLLGYEGGRPQNSGQMYPDPVTGYYFAAAMVMALRHRERTGQGQYIDVGMMEANASFIGDSLLEFAVDGHVRARLGNHHLRTAPHNIYPAREGRWLALAAEDNLAWEVLCMTLDRPDLAADPRFTTQPARKANEEALDGIIAEWTREQDADQAAEELSKRGVTAAPVLVILDMPHHPQLRARGFPVEVTHLEAGRYRQAGVPWRLTGTPAAVNRPAAMLGEHSSQVLADLLDVSESEYAELIAEGVTGDMPPEGVIAAAPL